MSCYKNMLFQIIVISIVFISGTYCLSGEISWRRIASYVFGASAASYIAHLISLWKGYNIYEDKK